MICILGEPEDTDLLWLAVAARDRGLDVEVVLPDELTVGSSLSCRITSDTTSWELRLRDGRALDARDVSLVVNRLTTLSPRPDPLLTPADATFLAEEWRACVAAWLRSMSCPVLNPPRAASLAGPVMSTQAWRAVAHAHGFNALPHRSDVPYLPVDPVTVISVGGVGVDPARAGDDDLYARLGAIATHVGTPLLGARFERADGALRFCDASVFPELRCMGDPLIDAIEAIARRGQLAS